MENLMNSRIYETTIEFNDYAMALLLNNYLLKFPYIEKIVHDDKIITIRGNNRHQIEYYIRDFFISYPNIYKIISHNCLNC